MRKMTLVQKRTWGWVALLWVLAFLCISTRGAEFPAGQEAVARMEAARAEVANVRSNVFLTLLALDQVRADLHPAHAPFQEFTNQLSRMEGLAKTFASRAEEMNARGKAYFVDWEARTATIPDPELRRRAEGRYSERKASYNEINQFMQDARKHFLGFVEALESLRAILLAGQRNQQIVAQAQDLYMRANWRCVDAQRALLEIETRFDRLAASFAKDVEPR